MHRPGDRTHDLFQTSLEAHRPIAGAERDGATTAIDILMNEGHDVVGISTSLATMTQRPAFDRLELLAWRMIDREQDRFTMALSADDRDGAVVAVDIASCFLDLLEAIRIQPISEQV